MSASRKNGGITKRSSRRANAVSSLHGHVSRRMWAHLWPWRVEEEIPIGHITNGVHLLGWMKGPVRNFWRRRLGVGWDRQLNSPGFWERMLDKDFVSDEELWALRYRLRRALIEFARRRFMMRSMTLGDGSTFDRLLDPDARIARCLAALFNPVLYPGTNRLLQISQEELGYLAGVSRLQYPPNLRVVRVNCTGMVHPDLVTHALNKGVDGVLVMG